MPNRDPAVTRTSSLHPWAEPVRYSRNTLVRPLELAFPRTLWGPIPEFPEPGCYQLAGGPWVHVQPSCPHQKGRR